MWGIVMMKIYGRANSINVRKVLWAAEEMGLPFEREDWGRGYRPTSEPDFVKVSPFGVVPVLDDEGFILRESNTIVRYLATKHNRADLFPTDLRTRATVESWMDWANTELMTGVRPVFHGLVVKNPAFQALEVAAGAKEWAKQMQLLENHLIASGPYVMGKNFTIADIPAALVVNRWFAIEFEKPVFKTLTAYYDRLAMRPAFRKHGRNGTP
jgi:glutathione S-transferase